LKTSTREPWIEHMNTIGLKTRLEGVGRRQPDSLERFKIRIDSEGPDKAGLSPLWRISGIADSPATHSNARRIGVAAPARWGGR